MSVMKLRGKINFPANVTGTGGLQVVKTNGIWTISPSWDDLELIETLSDPETKEIWARDPATDIFYRISVDAFIDSLPDGPAGPTGAAGATSGIQQVYSTTTADADPGAGIFRLNNATPASATAAYLDNLDAGGATVSSIIDVWDDSTNTTKGFLRIEKSSDPTKWAQFTVTGSVVDGTGYRKLTLSAGAGSGAFTDGDTFSLSFFRSGDAGTNGAVAISGTPTINQFANWTDATTIKGTSITGLVKGNGASAPAAAVAGTDYVAPGTATAFTAQQYFTLATITDAGNLSWIFPGAQKAKVTLGGNRIMLGTTGAVEGATYSLWVFQDATGSRTITWTTVGSGSFDFGALGAPTLTTTASRADLLTFEAVTIAGTLRLRFSGIVRGFA